MAAATGMKMQDVVEAAVADYERKAFWERTNARYAEPRGDREEGARVSAEREDESSALLDES